MEPLAILFGAAFTVAASYAMGRRILRSGDPAPLAFLTGAAALSAAVFVTAAVGIVYPVVYLAIGAVAVASARGRWLPPRKPAGAFPKLLLLPFAVFLVLYFFNAMAPEISPDGAAYHLGLVSRYLREHGFHRITTNMYANLSQGMEMLFLFAFAFGRHSAAAMVHFAFLLALAWCMWGYGRRTGFPLPAACAAFLVFASPVVGIDGISAYNDVAVAAVAFALFWLLEIWDEDRDPRLLIAIGLIAGFALAIKYTAGLAVPYAVCFVAWRSRQWRAAAIVAGCAAVLFLPWMVKNWLWLGNPLSPFFNDIFPNPYVMVSFEKEYKEYFTLYELKSRWEIPLQVTTYGSMSGMLGPVFLLAPVGLLTLRRREGRRLLLAAAVFGAFYFGNIGTRFLIPALPFVALAMMLALSGLNPRTGAAIPLAIALVHAVLCWPAVAARYCRPEAWRLTRIPWKQALRLRPADRYLEDNLVHYGVSRMIEQVTEPGATVFTFTPIPEAYTSRNIRVGYESAENKIAGAILWTPIVPEYAPTWRLRFAFPRQPLAGLRLVQTGGGTRDLWNMHEVRILDGQREVPRSTHWRITADPYPWGILDAFDNTLATFWMCGEWIRPGQYVRLDFNATETADSLVIETAPDQAGIRLRLDGRDSSGQWKVLAPEPRVSDAARPLGLGRAAVSELKRRGIGYILIFDSDLGAPEIQRAQDSWGMREAGSYRQAHLYKLL